MLSKCCCTKRVPISDVVLVQHQPWCRLQAASIDCVANNGVPQVLQMGPLCQHIRCLIVRKCYTGFQSIQTIHCEAVAYQLVRPVRERPEVKESKIACVLYDPPVTKAGNV